MSSAPIKISLKSATKMSLNSRFTTIMKSRPPVTTQTVRAQVSTAKLASDKNRRLSEQMERRPAVEEALGLKRNSSPPKTSVLDRLGVKTTTSGRGITRGRGMRRGLAGRGAANNSFTRGSSTQVQRGRGRGRGAVRGFTSYKGRVFKNSSQVGRGRGRSRGRPFRGGARGRGASRGRGGKPVSKDQLDNDLDKYMSKTKFSMDAELDSYMADVGK